jgi:chorismate--pyruvate lyase
MTELISSYLAALKKIDWQDIDKFEPSSDVSLHWLLEKGSLSRRLEQNCQNLSVELLFNDMVSSESVMPEEKRLLGETSCLLREVLLNGDNQDWVVGRTLIPEGSMQEQPHNLMKQGTIPLGLTVFSVDDVARDSLQFGWVKGEKQQLIARRSRLWMNKKPMLVAELFLPESPVYIKGIV